MRCQQWRLTKHKKEGFMRKSYVLICIVFVLFVSCSNEKRIEGTYIIKEIDNGDTIITQRTFGANKAYEKRFYVYLKDRRSGTKLTDLNVGTWRQISDKLIEIKTLNHKEYNPQNDSMKNVVVNTTDTLKIKNSTRESVEMFFDANDYLPSCWGKWTKIN